MLQHRLVAHRGYQKLYPENTLLAMRKAIEAGARHIETDIQFSADGVPLLYHDLAMKRLSGVDNLVSNLSLAELGQVSSHEPERLGGQFDGEPIATLDQLVTLLQHHPEVTAFVEIKRSAVQVAGVEQTYERIVSCLEPVAERAVLISFDYAFMAHARQRGYRRLGVVLQEWQDIDSQLVRDIAPEFVFCDCEKIPPGAALAALEPRLVVYEVADPGQAIALFDRGVDMIETFDIGGLIHALSRHAL